MPTKNDSLHHNHRQRMRERFLDAGLAGFSQHQVLEMLLFYTYPRIDTNEMAHNLINTFGSISAVFDADVEDIVARGKVTMNTAVLFKLITKCQEMYYTYQMEFEPYDNTEKLKELFLAAYAGVTKEEFRIACFDNNLRLIGGRTRCISTGSPSTSPVELRKIVETAISTKCSFIVLAHNHPNSTPDPGQEDIYATRKLNEYMRSIGVKILDHIIVGSHSAFSMRDAAILNAFE
ncbi:MAG: RadC family protein [Oscillospiraceae bacterium]|nr:RadC family protein [Oscillospiraceae bacterium]